MKKTRLCLFLAILLTLVVSGVASAQSGPTSVDAFTASPDAAPVTTEIDWTLDFSDLTSIYAGGGNDIAVCFYFPEGETGWQTNFAALGSRTGFSGDTYTVDTDDDCPPLSNYDSFYYVSTNPANFAFTSQDTITWPDVPVPSVGTGSKNFYARVYTGTDCDDSNNNGTDDPGGGTCNTTIGLGRFETFTVQASPATVYASDSANCGGYGTVGVSCFNSLDTAIAKVEAYNAATLTVVGNLTMDAGGSSLNTPNEPATLNGISNPTLVANASCVNTVLSVDNGATVTGITINGTPCTSGLYALNLGVDAVADDVTVQNFNDSDQYGVVMADGATLQNSTIQNNEVGVDYIATTTITITNNIIQNNDTYGVRVANTAVLQDNDITDNGLDGVQVFSDFTGMITENHINGNGRYGIRFDSAPGGPLTIEWNNITTSGTGAFANGSSSVFIGGNYLGDGASVTDLGGFDGAVVGSPFNRSTPGINTGNINRQSVGSGAGLVDFGVVDIAQSTGSSLDFVVIDLGVDTPFGVGADPYQNTQCSNYFDVYIDSPVGSSSLVTIRMTVNPGTCRQTEQQIDDLCPGGARAGQGSPIRWVNTDSSVWQLTQNVDCAADQSWAEGAIAANLLGGTGVAVMGANSPTIVSLSNLTATAARNTWVPVALVVLALASVGMLTIVRRKRQG